MVMRCIVMWLYTAQRSPDVIDRSVNKSRSRLPAPFVLASEIPTARNCHFGAAPSTPPKQTMAIPERESERTMTVYFFYSRDLVNGTDNGFEERCRVSLQESVFFWSVQFMRVWAIETKRNSGGHGNAIQAAELVSEAEVKIKGHLIRQ
jgi:hypothetical protein